MTKDVHTRRTILAAAGLSIGFARAASAQTPQATPTIAQYDLWNAAAEALSEAAASAFTAFFAGDNAWFAEHSTPELGAALVTLDMTELRTSLETNRFYLELSALGLWMDGSFSGGPLANGYIHQGAPGIFTLEAAEPQDGSRPTGLWHGMITDANQPFDIRFEPGAEPGSLQATLLIPEQNIDLPFDVVRFDESRPIGDELESRSLPLSPDTGGATSRRAWGDLYLDILATFDREMQLNGFALVPAAPLPPDPAAGFTSEIDYRLPSDQELLVFWGGSSDLQNYHATVPLQRHASDLVIWRDGATFAGDGLKLDDYFIWDTDVVSPCAGKVVEVMDEFTDIPPAIATGAAASPPVDEGTPSAANTHPAGNHVVIEAGPGEYILIGHMQSGSLKVSVNDSVAVGDVIGHVGNSGNTSEPHIHIQLQTTSDMFDPGIICLPLAFSGYRENGDPVVQGMPIQGQFVQSL